MSDSSMLIKKYFFSIESSKLSSVINQVELIAELSAEFTKADFSALFFQPTEHDNIIPLGFHNRSNLNIHDIQKLEDTWCHKFKNINEDDYNKIILSKNDSFADDYGFKYCFMQPLINDDAEQTFVVSYWVKRPESISNEKVRLIEYFLKILISAISKTKESRQLRDYSIRLSELIAMFEIPVGDYSFDQLVARLVSFADKSIAKFNFILFSYDEKNKMYLMSGKIPSLKPKTSFISSLSKNILTKSSGEDFSKMPKGTLFDLSKNYSEQYTAAIITPICYETQKKLFLAAYSNEKDALTQNNRELLSVFSLFANNILRDAVLLGKVSKANRLLKKSSAHLADIETLAALTDMTSGVAHDFNNTIGGIVGRVQLLKLKTEDEYTLNGLNKIEKLALDSAETVRRLQEFTTGVKSKKLVLIDLIETVTDYFEGTELKWKKKAVDKNISIKLKGNIKKAVIKGAESDLMVVLEKLLENAVEHADENSEVVLKISKDNKYYHLQVINHGVIINEQLRKKIFYPFFTTKDKYGAGLGLSIVQGIVIRHGGRVECKSDYKTGTIFKLSFPKPDRKDEDSQITRRRKVKEHLKILVVDDDEQIREVLTDMLTIDGYQITACEDGQSALKEFEADEFDLMITDLGMPGMSGLDLAGLVHESKPELPIAMITGWGTQLNEEEVALKGIKIVLPKPFHLKDIKDLIEELVIRA